MGIPWEIAKLGVRQGMWGAVKKIDPGLRAYQKQRASGDPLSRCGFMARINTKVSPDYLRSLEDNDTDLSAVEISNSSEKPLGKNIPKLLVVGGAIVLACSLDRGLLTKAVIFGVARRFAKIGRRLWSKIFFFFVFFLHDSDSASQRSHSKKRVMDFPTCYSFYKMGKKNSFVWYLSHDKAASDVKEVEIRK